jgi:hypothetical protein
MLPMLLLSALALALVFTARSETFAGDSYRPDLEADRAAKAGIQAAVKWFRSPHYQPVLADQAATYYNVTSDDSAFNLYSANSSPVQCISSSSTQCPTQNGPVQLISYGEKTSNFPADLTNDLSPAARVTNDFLASLQNVLITTASGDVGSFCVNAFLLNYQTANCSACTLRVIPTETWLITSLGVWGATSCNGMRARPLAIAEEQAIIRPIDTPDRR